MTAPTKAPEEAKESTSDTKNRIKQLAEKLRKQEAQDVLGAPSRAPKTAMLSDAKVMDALDPEHHYRYVNITDPEKVKLRRDRGYVPVSDEQAAEAGIVARHGNELVLMKVPIAKFNERVSQFKALNEARLSAHKTEVQGIAMQLVKLLKDKHGIDVPLDRLLVTD